MAVKATASVTITDVSDGIGVSKVTPLYYLKSNTSPPTAPGTAVTGTGTSVGVWTTAVPTYLDGYVYFTCTQTQYSDGTYKWSDVVMDEALTTANKNAYEANLKAAATNKVITDWCYANDKTYIDGGKIYAGTVSAKQINVTDLFAQDITATGTITGVTLKGAKGQFDSIDIRESIGITFTNENGVDETLEAIAVKAYSADETVTRVITIGGNDDTMIILGAFQVLMPTGSFWAPNIESTSADIGTAKIENLYIMSGIARANGTNDVGYIATNTVRSGALWVSAAGNLGIFDNTNSKWILYSDTSQNLHFGNTVVNPVFRFGIGNETPYVELRQAGNTGSKGLSLVYNDGAGGSNKFYNVINADGSLNLSLSSHRHNHIYASSGTMRVCMSSEDNLIPLLDSTGATKANVVNLGSGTNYYASVYYGGSLTKKSDMRVKNDLGDLPENAAVDLLRMLVAKKFTYKNDVQSIVNYGFYAQQVRDILIQKGFSHSALLDISDGRTEKRLTDLSAPEETVTYGLDYTQLVPILVKGWQYHDVEYQKINAEIMAMKILYENILKSLKGE